MNFFMFKSIKNFLFFKKVIDQNRNQLLEQFNIRVDKIYRLYTVFRIEEDNYKQYGEQLFINELEAYKTKLDNFLIRNGLSELYGIYLEERVEGSIVPQIKLGIRYRYLDTEYWANFAVTIGVSLLVGIGLGIGIGIIFYYLF